MLLGLIVVFCCCTELLCPQRQSTYRTVTSVYQYTPNAQCLGVDIKYTLSFL